MGDGLKTRVLGCLGLVLAWGMFSAGDSLWAGPTLELPDQALEVRPDPEVEQLKVLAQQLFDAAAAAIKVYQKKKSEPNAFKALAADIGKTFVTIKQLRRAAERLKVWGEGAAIDFLARADRLDLELQALITAYKMLPGAGEVSRVAQSQAEALVKQNLGQLGPNGKINRLAAGKKWEDAETAIHDVLDDVDIRTAWLDSQTNYKIVEPFLKALDVSKAEVLKIRLQRAQAVLTAAFQQAAPKYDEFFRDLSKAVAELKSKATTDWEGKPLAGPALAKAATARFRGLNLAALKARGLAWARGLNEKQPPADKDNDLERLLAAQSTAATRFTAALAEVIDADAQRATPNEASSIYQDYLPIIADYATQLADEALLKPLEAALDRLAAKSPPFAQEVAAYRRATSEVLRWRTLAAESAAKRRKNGYQPYLPLVLETAKPATGYQGLVPATSATMGDASLLGPAGDFLRQAQTKLATQKLLMGTALGAGTEMTPQLLGRYDSRTVSYGPITLPKEEIENLKADLFVAPNSPPLSLAAAMAIASAERGDAVEYGLVLTGCELRPLVTGWATLQERSAPWWPLTPFAREVGSAADGPVFVVLSGTVKWVRGKHIFHELER